MRPDVWVFDLDGTLVDSAPSIALALNKTLATVDLPPLSLHAVQGMIGEGAFTLVLRALVASGAEDRLDVSAVCRSFLDIYRALEAEGTTAFPGADALLRALHAKGTPLGLCTNKPDAPTFQVLDHLGWTGLFRAVLGGDARPYRKPDPRHLQDVILALGGGQAVMIGDSATDLGAAKAAGVPCVLIRHGYSVADVATMGADAVVSHLDELPRAVARL
ncbi:phosphoglycolate phosphatase [Myxococcota bacterium]|nr:phosphoglycolate phosphatase [Myxococcota bacterium]